MATSILYTICKLWTLRKIRAVNASRHIFWWAVLYTELDAIIGVIGQAQAEDGYLHSAVMLKNAPCSITATCVQPCPAQMDVT